VRLVASRSAVALLVLPPRSADALLATAVLLTAAVLGLGLGVVDEVHPAHPTANASEITTIKLTATIFFVFKLPRSYSVRYKQAERT
jgi:hypothetical protein